jgi:Domain of unknown function (DUF4192)
MATNTINLKSPHELLAVVPFVLGFCPTSSIMVLCLINNRLGLTQRLDLPRPEDARQVALALMPSLVAGRGLDCRTSTKGDTSMESNCA